MKKLALLGFSSLLLFLLLLSPVNVLAAVDDGQPCSITNAQPNGDCKQGSSCTPKDATNPTDRICVKGDFINIVPPAGKGFPTLGSFVTNTLTIAFAVAILVVLVMLIWGAFEWITSGGDKEAVGKARGRIINALIGLAVLAIAFALARVAAQFLGFDIGNIEIPRPPVTGPGS